MRRALLAVVVSLMVGTSARSQDLAPLTAFKRYLALPGAVDNIITQNLDETIAKGRIGEAFAGAFTGPLLDKVLTWLENTSLRGEEVENVVTSMRHVGPEPPVRVIRVAGALAQLEADITIVERYGLGYKLMSIEWLFDRYPITNTGLSDAVRRAKSTGNPDRLVFEVTSSNRLTLSVVRLDSDWKVSDASSVVRTATLRIEP